MMQVPLQPVPSQTVNFVLGGQNCQIFIYQKPEGMFFDLNSNGVEIVSCVRVLNIVPLVCIQYTGFQGNFFFIDTQGVSDPTYEGLGTQYALVYLTAEENLLLGYQSDVG